MNDDLISRISLKQSIAISMILAEEKTLEQIIDEEPSIELVRCKDCKYYEPKDRNFSCNLFSDLGSANNDDDFCAWAERRGIMSKHNKIAICATITNEDESNFYCDTEWGDVTDDEIVVALVSIFEDINDDPHKSKLVKRAMETFMAMEADRK